MPISPDETILASADEFIESQFCGRATPLFPASSPATRSFNGLHPESKFLAIQSRLSAAPCPANGSATGKKTTAGPSAAASPGLIWIRTSAALPARQLIRSTRE